MFHSSFDIQIPCLRARCILLNDNLRFKGSIWISGLVLKRRIWTSELISETQILVCILVAEIQILYLKLRCQDLFLALSFRCHIWDSDDGLQMGIWESKTVSESHIWYLKHGSDIQNMDLRPRFYSGDWHPKLQYPVGYWDTCVTFGIWAQNHVFSSQIPFAIYRLWDSDARIWDSDHCL